MQTYTTPELQTEIWLPIPKYEGLYEISNYGRMKSLPKPYNPKGSFLKLGLIKSERKSGGYYVVTLHKPNIKQFTTFVHRLVGLVFLPPTDLENPEINHKDTNTLNNYYLNLEWVTHLQNVHHAIENGLWIPTTQFKGRKHTQESIEKIRAARLGIPRGPMSDKHKENIRKALKEVWAIKLQDDSLSANQS